MGLKGPETRTTKTTLDSIEFKAGEHINVCAYGAQAVPVLDHDAGLVGARAR